MPKFRLFVQKLNRGCRKLNEQALNLPNNWCETGTGKTQSQSLLGTSMIRSAKFQIGQIVKHRIYPFRGIVFDVDPIFDNLDEWYDAIPEDIRPAKDQPFYHLFAENEETEYIAYVSEQNLLADDQATTLRHPQIGEMFRRDREGHYVARDKTSH